jgi:D-arabinose 1-dehydrogenase-like Zn-dependent alcohol dehydrogenase
MGMGGMGHLAVKLSAALGYETVVYTRSAAKKQDALEFGASEFHVLESDGSSNIFTVISDCPTEKAKPVDHLLVCTSVIADFSTIMPLVVTHGTIYPLTTKLEPTLVPLLALIDNGIRIQGSLTASKTSVCELLRFCTEHNVFPMIESFDFNQSGIQRALGCLQEGAVKYKCVLTNSI